MYRIFRLAAILACLTLPECRFAYAIAPVYVSDVELAAYPIIVVAKWEKAPARLHKYRGENSIEKYEVYTRLSILKVIKGDVEPGEKDLKVDRGITWNEKNGTNLNSGTSTQLSGDVDAVTEPALWFLKRTRSWDERLKDEYLTIANYRVVQPPELREFYLALGGPDPAKEVPKLLTPEQPVVARRILRYISGGEWSWPYWPLPWERKREKSGPLLTGEGGRVWEFIKSSAKDRKFATSVYAELSGVDGIPNLRTLLEDSDPMVRGIAVGILARHRDAESASRFPKALEGLGDAYISCQVIMALASWQDERMVPSFISFLQNDRTAYVHGDDFGIPALKARDVLEAATGHVFPFDVNVSQKAWEEARKLRSEAARNKLLEKLAPESLAPNLPKK